MMHAGCEMYVVVPVVTPLDQGFGSSKRCIHGALIG